MIPFCAPNITSDDVEAVADCVRSGWIGPGEANAKFAAEIKIFTGAHYVVLTNSGTTALQVVVHALDLPLDATVLVPAYGPTATANAFRLMGMNVRHVDIDQRTGCMRPDAVDASIDDRVTAVCFVNFSGYTGDGLLAIMEICRARGVLLIEDAACALGHRLDVHADRRHAGLIGRAGVFSFSPHKLVTTGQGGAVLLQRDADWHRASDFVDQGDAFRTGAMGAAGGNMRMSDINAALGLSQMNNINGRIAKKRLLHSLLDADVPVFKTPSGPPLHNIVWIRDAKPTVYDEQSGLVARLRSHGIEACRQYPLHPLVKGNDACPGANWWDQHAVYLPFGGSLTAEDVERISETLLLPEVARGRMEVPE